VVVFLTNSPFLTSNKLIKFSAVVSVKPFLDNTAVILNLSDPGAA